MTSRERIIKAAIQVFAAKGRHGAHMEEIASTAHINKAMIYYIFHNKDELYFEVLKSVLGRAWESMSPITPEFRNRDEFKKILSEFISSQIEFFFNNRNYTKILVDAMGSGAEEIPQVVEFLKKSNRDYDSAGGIKSFIENGKKSGILRDINTDQLIISITGMVLIYFLSHSINISLDIDVGDESGFMKARRESIIDLVMNGIMTEKNEQ